MKKDITIKAIWSKAIVEYTVNYWLEDLKGNLQGAGGSENAGFTKDVAARGSGQTGDKTRVNSGSTDTEEWAGMVKSFDGFE